MRFVRNGLDPADYIYSETKEDYILYLASMQGYNPATAIEFGRKVLFSTERPGFLELETHVKGKK